MVSMVIAQNGVTPLYFVLKQGHVTIVTLLLEKVADVNVVVDFLFCTCVRMFSHLVLCVLTFCCALEIQ